MFEKLTIHELKSKIKNKEVSLKEVLDDLFVRIEKIEPKIGAYISFTKEYAYKRAEMLQVKIDNGEDVGILGGVPIAVKDNMCMKDTKTTCASKILENFVSPYDATIIKKIEDAGGIIIGKTNMDEFAMGSSTENSAIKKTANPWDLTRVPGGSSGGSAAAVTADMAYAALGSDTGGSIRQPAAYCSVVGIKPTYGLVSRFGLVAFASSLDQIGPLTKDVEDTALMLNAIAGHDTMDSTSVDIKYPDYTKALVNDVKGMTIGIPTEFFSKGLNSEIKKSFDMSIEKLKLLGADVKDVKLEYAKYALATYYIISPAEASSNLARYDGIKYGYRAKEFDSLYDLYAASRTEGFGEEVKKRIMLGTYVLSSGYYDAYYKKASQVRTLIIEDFKKAFKDVDVIALPTAPGTAFKFGEKTSNAIEMYLEDVFTVPVNIAGIPGISIPSGFDSKGLPIGLQFIAPAFGEEKLLQVAYTFEQNTDYHTKKPNLEGGK